MIDSNANPTDSGITDPHAVEYSKLQPTIVSDDAHRKVIAKQIVGLLKARYGDRLKELHVLDVGCSGGQITAAVGNHVKEVVGIDPDRSAIDHAIYKYSAPGRASFLVGDALDLPFKAESFDLIINNQVYEFVRDDTTMMTEMYRVLKPGGEVLFGARNKWALVEAQYGLPFLSWLPELLQTPYVCLTGRGELYHGRYRGYSGLRELVEGRLPSRTPLGNRPELATPQGSPDASRFPRFAIDDYTIRILREPTKYGFDRYERYAGLARLLPLDWFQGLLPNYLWFLKKR